jgi:hypothetical protein
LNSFTLKKKALPSFEMSGNVTLKVWGDVTEHFNLITDFCEDFPACVQGAMPVVAFEKSVGRLYAMVSLF